MTIARRLRLVRCARQSRLSQGLTGRYARFLLEELIPEVQTRYPIIDEPWLWRDYPKAG